MKITNPFVSAFASTRFARLALGVGVSTLAIASMILPQAASAQTAPGNIQSFPDSSRQNERDSFGGNLGGGDFNIFQMIHQSQLGGTRDMGEYSQEQNRNLNNAAEAFKRQQRALIGNPEPQLLENPATNNQPENPQGN
ncbi:hypothetical protein [Allocoleopsis franciscana]|uniref:Uncharacterized protein n=1 Tax=Allocoleopsis franciscana PCC 7113 TaxID=1173027 RepID=K9WKG7_9CYAN|nr:hypothetical protein [Allocoleopsis franciscana]AFZ20306.1 hypothetical protein Mic7113_4626 [Allocoleopsis franciscana PCC 7113]